MRLNGWLCTMQIESLRAVRRFVRVIELQVPGAAVRLKFHSVAVCCSNRLSRLLFRTVIC